MMKRISPALRHGRVLAVLIAGFLMAGADGPAAGADAPVRAERYMISTANPHATAAGLEMLRAGGSAVDAALAAQAVLSLVEPQSSGIGGGGFLMHYHAEDGRVEAYDGRETAPAGLDPELFLDAEGAPLGFLEAALGGAAVGVPGVLRMLELAHSDHGRLEWASLFAPAIRLAEEGFEISPRLHFLLAQRAEFYRERDFDATRLGPAAGYFFDEQGMARPVGYRLRNPAYAATLRAIASDGASAFYSGPIAEAMVAAVRQATIRPGYLTMEDLAAYRPVKRAALCGPYRQWRLCSMGPPSSGATTMLAILGLLEGFDMAALAPDSAAAVHLFAEASKLAYADRDLYIGDPDFVSVPTRGLIDNAYLAERRRLIDPDSALAEVGPGRPQSDHGRHLAPNDGIEYPATSHLSVVDGQGNAVAFTTTVQIAFGSFVMVEGFLLNNQLTDFSFRLEQDGRAIANRPAPGKRPRSSMTPTLVFDSEGAFRMAIGSPGGSRIIDYVAKTLVAVLDWGMDIQAAISFPNIIGKDGAVEVEAGGLHEAVIPELEALGHNVRSRGLNSGLHGITTHRGADGAVYYLGGADPRREGVAAGD